MSDRQTAAVGPPAVLTPSPSPSKSAAVDPPKESSTAPPPSSSSPAPPPPSSTKEPESSSSDPPPPSTTSPSTTSPSTTPSPTTSETPTSSSQSSSAISTPPSVVIETSTSTPISSASAISSAPSSSSASSTSVLTLTQTRSGTAPSLNTSGRPSASADAGKSDQDSTSSSGLSAGAIAGIVIGCIAAIALVAFLATGYFRRRSRARRTANRSSMFEPWQTAVATEDPTYEKSYPMDTQPSFPPADQFDPNYGYQQGYQPYPQDAYDQYPNQSQFAAYPDAAAGAGVAAAGVGAYAAQPGFEQGTTTSPTHATSDVPHPMSPPASSTGHGVGAAAGLAGAAGVAGAAAAAAAAGTPGGPVAEGLHDGMMVRVKVGFVRSLEDELAITQGQQLYLHTTYDDGWCLCEDDAHNRGVVPVSCLEPWQQ